LIYELQTETYSIGLILSDFFILGYVPVDFFNIPKCVFPSFKVLILKIEAYISERVLKIHFNLK